ncbi:hypothetical protein OKJ48_40890 [Streptomyces kunmingensis]|uniref:DUF2269 domain-containing protein n=1 Tax=Streptomyces kunmingensis TaxID=68225 RepID=A0ABU6CPF8_9ACTN|nr:hypothetical protein [Streptomyces kunmingensis]MEB3966543.1 hypothetical protein [Streptomyces kunmingensis]
MTKFLLTLHVLAAVLTVGPVAVAASMFPKSLRQALGSPDDAEPVSALGTLHRICRVYAVIGVAVPLFGFATAGSLGVLGSAWLIASILLTAAAAGVLALLILPAQEAALVAVREPGAGSLPRNAGQLAALTGVFNLLWATVTVLMIVRPGSTTGA